MLSITTDRRAVKVIILAGISALVLGVVLVFGIGRKPESRERWRALEQHGDDAFQAHDLAGARAYWFQALEKRPGLAGIYNKLAISFMVESDYRNALEMVNRGLQVENKSLALRYNQALSCYHLEDFAGSLDALERLIGRNPEFPYPEAHALRGLCLDKMGRHAEARRAYVEEINANPGSRLAWREIHREQCQE